ncbi:pre-mRNA-splicing factor 18-like [Paramacrobiotus metropolitanus]|uniref:pre-mRNA-splicing factor 18-like n=1 Tax=Paramacrobiotus metropolitanus TaxID=2943436 RepID=UPI0024460E5A|nr:pre-mRNA-splicing factor 18-like [Paramacrobiotus metropolitanus]
MDALRAEIQKKRKFLEAISKPEKASEPVKKFYKRSDLEQKAKSKEEYNSTREATPDTLLVKTKDYDGSRLQSDHSEDVKLPRKEVIRRLRERNEPVRLFGESDEESMKRLKDLEVQEPEVDDGLRNDFKAAMDKIDLEFMNELAKGQSTSSKTATDIKIQDDGTTMEDIQKLGGEVQKNESVGRDVILKFMKFILCRWAEELNRRSLEEKLSTKGKLDRGTYVQTEEYLKPLFQKLKNKSLQDDISQNLLRIIVFLLDRDYVKANEVFLQMAIGNAPWPIGVTAVGIHSRPGREKVFSQMIAHVLNDETQRKYIQGFKRLITKMQQLFPTDPSRSVEFQAINRPKSDN